MKILVFSNCKLDPHLGSGKTRLRWSDGLRALGHDVRVVQPQDFRPGVHQGRADQMRFAWDALVYGRKLAWERYDLVEFFGGSFGWLTRYLRAKRHTRPMLVAHSDGLELLAAERARVFSPDQHRQVLHKLSSPVYRHIYTLAFRNVDAFVCGCEEDKRFFEAQRAFGHVKTMVIAPGIDGEFLRRTLGAQTALRVGFTGTWSPRKAPDRVVRVMSAVFDAAPEVGFDVFGAFDSERLVRSAFPERHRLRVMVHPRLSAEELAARLSACRVFFFPSNNEGFGMGLTEAMACGVAAVTTPTGFGATLEDGREAVVCDFADESRMVRSILRLLSDDETRSRLARRGWERVQALRWEHQVKTLEETYLRWLSGSTA